MTEKIDRRLKYKRKHRAAGLCVDCAKPAFPGHSRCLEHIEKGLKQKAQYYVENREKVDARIARRRKQLVEQSRCPGCGKPLDADADAGRIYCCNCRDRLIKESKRSAPHANITQILARRS